MRPSTFTPLTHALSPLPTPAGRNSMDQPGAGRLRRRRTRSASSSAGSSNRFPQARLLLGHMGETLPYLLWRLDKRTQAFSDVETIKPSMIFRRNVAITTAGTF